MTTTRQPAAPQPFTANAQQRITTYAAALLTLIMATAIIHRAVTGQPFWPDRVDGIIILHVLSVVPTIPLGAYLFWQTKGTPRHRLLGRIWSVLMLVTAFTSFGIHSLTGQFSWIHLLSIVVIVSVTRGIWFAMHGDIARHRRSMVGAFTGITLAGFFTFAPGRLLGLWLFG